MAQISGIIQQQSYELAGDAIGSILADEIAGQYQQSGNAEYNATVWKERFIPFDAKTEMPAVNIRLANGTYSNKDQTLADGEYKYTIAAYVYSPNASDGNGDKDATLKLQRILGICRSILETPIYNNLNLSRPFVKNTRVGSITLGVTDETAGAENIICGYLEFFVTVPEYVILKDPLPLLNSTTQVKLYETDKGYLWGSNSADGSLFIAEDESPIFALQYFETENGGVTPTMKFSELPVDATFNSDTRIIVIQPNDSGGFDNYYATPAQISSGASRKLITSAVTGTTLTDVFFANPITGLATNNQFYIIGENFTQDTGTNTITGVNISFYTGQILIAYV